MAEPRTFTVSDDDDGIRLDRWFKRNAPDISFNLLSRWSRTGQLKLDGKRATPGDRIEAGQKIQVPSVAATPARSPRPERKRDLLTPEETELVRDMSALASGKALPSSGGLLHCTKKALKAALQ